MSAFYLFEQREIAGFLVNNEWVAENIIIEADSTHKASMILQSITMDWNDQDINGKRRWPIAAAKKSDDYKNIMDNSKQTIIYLKGGKRLLNFLTDCME